MTDFRFVHEHDLVFFFQDLDAATGCGSSFDALANLALSGIPDGGTIAQPTKARFRSQCANSETPSDRAARIRGVLAKVPEAARILAAHYTIGKWNERRREADPTLSPLQAAFRAQAGVVARIAGQEGTTAALMLRSSSKTDRLSGKVEIQRIKKLAERAVDAAQRAYQDAAGKRKGKPWLIETMTERAVRRADFASDVMDAMAEDQDRFGGRTRPLTSDERADRGDW